MKYVYKVFWNDGLLTATYDSLKIAVSKVYCLMRDGEKEVWIERVVEGEENEKFNKE